MNRSNRRNKTLLRTFLLIKFRYRRQESPNQVELFVYLYNLETIECNVFYNVCLFFALVNGIFTPETFLLYNKNSLKKHYAFQEQMKCQLQKLQWLETCTASIYSTQTTLKCITAYFCFSKEIRWTTHFYLFGSKWKYSLLPLVGFGHLQTGEPRQGQLVSPNFILQGKPSYYEKYHSGRTLIFRVNSRYVLFENYTATHF